MQKLSLLFQLIQPPPILNKNRKSAPETILPPKLNKLKQKIFCISILRVRFFHFYFILFKYT